MAQTKKKRRSKHRGNAAGVIESRGRTGRPPSASERKQTDKERAAQARRDRMMREPTWKSATTRAALAAVVFGVLLVFAFATEVPQAISLTAMVFLFYIPLGYYTDQFIYRRRVKSEAAKSASTKTNATKTNATKTNATKTNGAKANGKARVK